MRFFADTADIVEIRDLQNANLIQGVTTNPTLVQRAGRKDFTKCMEEICDIVEGPVSAEVTSPTYLEMVKQGIELATIAHNIVVKLPCDIEGMKACKTLSDKGILEPNKDSTPIENAISVAEGIAHPRKVY